MQYMHMNLYIVLTKRLCVILLVYINRQWRDTPAGSLTLLYKPPPLPQPISQDMIRTTKHQELKHKFAQLIRKT